ncbi:MAG: APC family permease [Actinomycetota bacterium]
MAAGAGEPPDRLARRLTTVDAVVIGMGAMIGAGIFAAVRPAAEAAGAGLLIGLAVAAVVAYCNAASSAQLAAVYPESGGTYVYGRERLGPFWGYLAGWGFVVGKTASLAAMALTVGLYVAPDLGRPVALASVVAMTAVNYRGIRKTALLTRLIVTVVVASLAAVVAASLFGGTAGADNLGPLGRGGVAGVLQSAGLLFFAFAGYARIATLGEEVVEPHRSIPRAILISLTLVLLLYATVAAAGLLAVGPEVISRAPAPLAAAVEAGSLARVAPAVRIGAGVAALGVLLSLLAGVSRTVYAMARNRELPGFLAAVHPRHLTPHRAEIAVALVVTAVVLLADLRGAIGFSSFAVLVYYGIANVSAWTQPPEQRRWPRLVQVVGLLGCALLAFTLPATSVVVGVAVLAAVAALWLVLGRRSP